MDERRKKYEQKRILKNVSFNSDTDADLLEFIKQMDDFSGTVKALLRNKMKQEREGV